MYSLAILFTLASQTQNIPPGLLSALCWVESRHTITAMHKDDGGSHSVGVCQVKLGTARFFGYKGDEKGLKDPVVNVYYAGQYLGWQLRRYKGNTTKAVAAYNAGTYRTKDTGEIHNSRYVKNVNAAWRAKK